MQLQYNSRSAPSPLDQLVRLVTQHALTDGDHPTRLPNMSLHRRRAPTANLHCIYSLGLGVTLQGQKQVTVQGRTVTTDAGEGMLVAVDVPAVSQVSRASRREPYLGLLLKLDPAEIVDAAEGLDPALMRAADEPAPFTSARVEPALLEALLRLVRLLDEPGLAPQLAPLVKREILIRLLYGSCGGRLRQMAMAGSPESRILRALSVLKQNLANRMRVDDLARSANMSPSAFRQHFRAVTGISPLQYQKQLRLQEARQAMLTRNLGVTQAARLVGYESVSQFSREYSRLFGDSPQRDIRQLRLGA